ncbi:MAG: D-sedoheptulose 7-phosphate isomerase [Bacteroidia bacterium]
MFTYIQNEVDAHQLLFTQTITSCKKTIAEAAEHVSRVLAAGGKVMLCGNGGSAADAQHIATELSGRFRKERKALAAIALTTDTSALTAISNDYGYEQVFARQVEAIAKPGDVLIGISTSGSSPNVLEAAKAAKAADCTVISMTGEAGDSPLVAQANVAIQIPSRDTARIQEMHILAGHIICGWVENNL